MVLPSPTPRACRRGGEHVNDGHAIADLAWVDDVLRFWLDELSETQWFDNYPGLDARIRSRFLGLHQRMLIQAGADAITPRAALATVIVLDRFPRNMFRGDPRAYAADPIARDIAKAAIASG